jgi:hypothetical protein
MAKPQKRLPPIDPGEILRAEFMEPLKLSMNRLALDLRRSGDAYCGDRSGTSRNHARYRPAACTVLPNQRAFLAESPICV